jgi:arabinofuranan 3-O-arabinosyltransferase
VLVAVVAAAVLGFCFGLRAGVVLGPLLGVVLWRGVADRVLVLAAGALLTIGVPVAYVLAALLADRGNPGGYDTTYASDRIAGHWLALAALTALGLVLWRTLAAARAGRRPPQTGPGPAAATQPLPSALVTSGPPAPTP